MSTVAEIESAIQKLDAKELGELSLWFEEFVGQAWDEKVSREAKAGKFARIKDEISREEAAGDLLDFP